MKRIQCTKYYNQSTSGRKKKIASNMNEIFKGGGKGDKTEKYARDDLKIS